MAESNGSLWDKQPGPDWFPDDYLREARRQTHRDYLPSLSRSLSLSLSISKVGNFGNIFLFYKYLRSRSVVNHKTYVGHASFNEYYSQRIASPYVENA